MIIAVERMFPSAARGDHSWHPGELRMKLLDIRPHDCDVAAGLTVRIEQH